MATIYVNSYQEKATTDTISVGGTNIRITTLFKEYEEQLLKTSVGETHIGIPVSQILDYAGVITPIENQYVLIAADGYSKEMRYDYIKKSLLTQEGRIVFADLPKQFWVRDIVEIRVK
jgi:hypothetical protein